MINRKENEPSKKVPSVDEDLTKIMKLWATASACFAPLAEEQPLLDSFTHLASSFISDWCAVDAVTQDGTIYRAAVFHRDPEALQLLRKHHATGLDLSHSIAEEVIHSGKEHQTTAVSSHVLNLIAPTEQQRTLTASLTPSLCLCVPLSAHQGVLGAASFFFGSSRNIREYSLELARTLSAQAALAWASTRLKAELNVANQRKDRFLAVLAHELRNPLATILSGINLLQRPITDERSEWVKKALERQTKQLARLIDDLLDVSRLTQGKIELSKETVKLKTVVDAAVTEVEELILKRKHSFQVSLPKKDIWIHVDPPRLQQIIVNLLTNAAKYTDPGGSISLTAMIQNSELWLKVKDSGMGVPTEIAPKLFELFQQLDSSTGRAHGGLGIGLTLVNKLTQLHNGRASVKSEGPGKGSEFIVQLPVLAIAIPAERPETSLGTVSRLKPFKVLVVEDNKDSALMMASLLSDSGHEVKIASDGFSALDTAANWDAEVVLLDIGLPGIDGYEVARRLRNYKHLSNCLIVAISGYGQQQDRERSSAAGFDYHLLKPVDFDVLQDLLANWQNS